VGLRVQRHAFGSGRGAGWRALRAIVLSTALLATSAGPGLAATPVEAAGQRLPVDGVDLGSLVDRIVTAQLTEDRIPGAVVTVVDDGRTVLSRGYGLADVARGTVVDADETRLFPASVAKLFTATAASRLIVQGRIDPHADVNEYLTSFRIHDSFPGRPVTMDHLLTHTAGFDQDSNPIPTTSPRPWPPDIDRRAMATRSRAASSAPGHRPAAEP
jgi:CubicO group peptidase (beta-lactamase class C family)